MRTDGENRAEEHTLRGRTKRSIPRRRKNTCRLALLLERLPVYPSYRSWICTSLSKEKVSSECIPHPTAVGICLTNKRRRPYATLYTSLYVCVLRISTFFVPCQSWNFIVDLNMFSQRHLFWRYITRLRDERKKVANAFSSGTVGPLR